MTTKSYTIGSEYSPFFERVSKVGNDGKYDIDIHGIRTIRWNDYTSFIETTHGSASTGYPYPGRNAGNFIAGNPVDWTNPMFTSDQTLQNKLVNKIKQHQFNLGVALGEGKQTFHLITDNVRALGYAARDVRRGRFNDALRRLGSQFEANEVFVGTRRSATHITNGKKFSDSPRPLNTKDFTNRWLEIQFGWKPLLSDVYEGTLALKALENPRAALIRVGSNTHGTFNGSLSPTNWACPGVWRCKQSLYYELRETLTTNRSLSLDDPWSVAWELLPYSFCIDWFLPIGSFIENLNQIPRLKGRSMKVKWVKSLWRSKILNPTYYYGASTDGICVRMERVCTTSGVPLALPQFKTLDKALSPTHIFDVCALARQHFG